MSHRLAAIAVTAALGAVAAPSAASAATLTVAPCSPAVSGQDTVPIGGSGFTPNSFVTLRADGNIFSGGATADAAGNFASYFSAPLFSSIRRNKQTFQLTASDAAGVPAGPVPLTVTRVTATLPQRAKPRKVVRYRVFGFAPGKRVYLHVRRNGRTLGSFRIGKAKGPCGQTSRRLRYMPLRSYRTGTYDYYFQLTKKFRKKAPRVKLRIIITRRFVG